MSGPGLRAVAVVLAAGRSTRMGDVNKLLAEIEPDVPMIRRVVENALRAQIGGVIVVTGHEPQRVRDALRETQCRIVHNPHYADGLSASLKAGFAAACDSGADGAVILLGDMPFVSAATIDIVLDSARRNPDRIVQPVAAGKPAHPVWLPARLRASIDMLQGDSGARELGGEDQVAVEVDEQAAFDIDTAEMLSRAIEDGSAAR